MILFGDMNFKLNFDHKKAKKTYLAQDFEELASHDELTEYRET